MFCDNNYVISSFLILAGFVFNIVGRDRQRIFLKRQVLVYVSKSPRILQTYEWVVEK